VGCDSRRGVRRGSYGNTAIQCTTPNAARTQWQYCHSAPERPRSCYRAARDSYAGPTALRIDRT